MLMPKRVKYRKQHRGRRAGLATRGNEVSFGEFGLQALGACWMNSRQIEAARRAIVRYLRRGGKLWIRVFPDHPVTKRPAETRMGGGKGAVEYWAAVVQARPDVVRGGRRYRGRSPRGDAFGIAQAADPGAVRSSRTGGASLR